MTKTIVFVGKYPLQTKTVLDNESMEQVSHFCYIGSYFDIDHDIDNKLTKFQSICRTIQQMLSRKMRKEI